MSPFCRFSICGAAGFEVTADFGGIVGGGLSRFPGVVGVRVFVFDGSILEYFFAGDDVSKVIGLCERFSEFWFRLSSFPFRLSLS